LPPSIKHQTHAVNYYLKSLLPALLCAVLLCPALRCAAGAGLADLSSQQAAPEMERAPLPSVTMVFASVEGGRALLRRRQDVGLLVHAVIGRVMQVRGLQAIRQQAMTV
jgi:hypothetical protein